MSDETKKDNDFESALEAIQNKLGEKMETKFSDLDQKLDDKFSKLKEDKEPSNEDDSNDDSDAGIDDDTDFVTKKDLKRLIKDLPTIVERTATKVADKAFETKTTRLTKDQEAAQDFPMLNAKSGEYNQDFYKEVNEEVKARLGRGHSSEDPGLIYDAAAVVEKKWIRDGRYLPKSAAEKVNQQLNARGDNFNVSGTSKTQNAPTQRQVEIALKMGLSKEKLAQHMKNIR